MPLTERLIWALMWLQFAGATAGAIVYLFDPNPLQVFQTLMNAAGGVYAAVCLRSVRRTRAERETERAAYASTGVS